jgi:hypothetical protein
MTPATPCTRRCRTVRREEVRAIIAVEDVGAGTAVEAVRADVPSQVVVPGPAGDVLDRRVDVVVLAGLAVVRHPVQVHRDVARSARVAHGVGSARPEIVVPATVNVSLPPRAVSRVGAATAVDDVVRRAAGDRVVRARS